MQALLTKRANGMTGRKMFTGLVQNIGIISSIRDNGADKRIVIETDMGLGNVSVGGSIACSGCCLTVVKIDGRVFSVDVSGETLAVTTLSEWQVGSRVNIEPSLRLGDELGGHLVSGHVDGVAVLEAVEPDGGSRRLKIRAPEELSGFIAAKGSVTLDGVSLTVNEVEGAVFGVNIIPHTWEKTTLGYKSVGDVLNIEVDMLARYVARMLSKDAA